ncbi:protein FAR1-RELATED SEQUENCE 5-like [Humulus lupulus]|uniref:protein FAR1-RELATED SEQUENCE 5-like n=1 Tax=Humulus lupulus TaxID=3486 RepID=UPI002B405337|nr:protein FAR1-RELATED SEQUENCE 5-like [Humulus lupulus]
MLKITLNKYIKAIRDSNIDILNAFHALQGDITDIDLSSNPHWEEILGSLQLYKPVAEIDTTDIRGKDMETLDKWEDFYKTYAKWVGFDFRIDDTKYRDDIISICRILRMKDTNLWRCKEFVAPHNHDLVIPSQMHFLHSNCEVPEAMASQVMSMKICGIKPSLAVTPMALQSGGYDNLSFQLRDVYNKVSTLRKLDNLSSESEGVLSFLDDLSTKDPNIYVEYKLDEQNRLANLFWVDGVSRREYMLFGEVIAFESMYKMNKYNKPLAIVVGVNQHFETCVFECALIVDETEDTL